jgi:DNA-binding MarR family transcriptional regulator
VDLLVLDGLVIRSGDRLQISLAGRDVARRLYKARAKGLAHLLDGWEPEANPELAELLTRLSQTTMGDHSDRPVAR